MANEKKELSKEEQEAIKKVEEAVESLNNQEEKREIKNLADEVVDSFEEKKEAIKAEIKDTAEELEQKAQELKEDVTDLAKETKEGIEDSAKSVVEGAKEEIDDTAKEIDNLIEFFSKNSCEYAYNHIPKNNLYPDGLGAEIINFKLLEELNRVVSKERNKEHCFSYITENSDKFIIKTFNPKKELQYPNLRFDIDTFEDYYRLSMIDFDIDISSEDLIKLFLEKK